MRITITIPPNDYNTLSITTLRDTEQNILNYMLLSKENFIEVEKELTIDDFTFFIHKLIFSKLYIIKYKIFYPDKSFDSLFQKTMQKRENKISKFDYALELLSKLLYQDYNQEIATTLDILSQPPSVDIKSDIKVIKDNSVEKEMALLSTSKTRLNGTVETKEYICSCKFVNNKLIQVDTNNIFSLPLELHNNLADTMLKISNIDTNNKDNELYAECDEDFKNFVYFYLKKNLSSIKWFEDICKWADEYNLDEETFPRDRFKLQNLTILNLSGKKITKLPKEISNLSNLEVMDLSNNYLSEFPKELYQLKRLEFLHFSNNTVSLMDEDIINLENLKIFASHNNKIAKLPKNFFKLKKLSIVSLCNCNLTSIPKEIENLSNLESLNISNNDIKELPHTLSKLKNLNSLDIRNTKISDIPIEVLQDTKLTRLSINDALFPFVAENIRYLDVNTIDLSESHIDSSMETVNRLNLEINTGRGIRKENGCVRLYKKKEV